MAVCRGSLRSDGAERGRTGELIALSKEKKEE